MTCLPRTPNFFLSIRWIVKALSRSAAAAKPQNWASTSNAVLKNRTPETSLSLNISQQDRGPEPKEDCRRHASPRQLDTVATVDGSPGFPNVNKSVKSEKCNSD